MYRYLSGMVSWGEEACGRVTGGRASSRDIHDCVAHRKNQPRRQWLGEEIGQVICAVHEGNCDVVGFDAFTHKEMAAVNVFRALMMLR
eukprot:6208627-Pleurochrysis_carterae.AAC.1